MGIIEASNKADVYYKSFKNNVRKRIQALQNEEDKDEWQPDTSNPQTKSVDIHPRKV